MANRLSAADGAADRAVWPVHALARHQRWRLRYPDYRFDLPTGRHRRDLVWHRHMACALEIQKTSWLGTTRAVKVPHSPVPTSEVDYRRREETMAVARVTKLTASSSKGFDDAVERGIKRAAKTLRGLTGLHVVEQKAKIDKGKITEYRVTMEVTFVLED